MSLTTLLSFFLSPTENYDDRTGGKMELQALKMYLMSQYGVERVDALFWEIQMIILRSLLAVSQVMINDKHCFELYVSSVLLIIALFVMIFASVSVFYF